MAGGVLARAAVAVAVLVGAAAARAQPLLLPGRMGANALPALRNADPVIGHDIELELAAATQVSGLDARDAAFLPYFRLTVPFRAVAALELDGAPLEAFRTSAETQARIGAARREGFAPADVRASARFLLLEEEGRRPAVGFKLAVKSTTGKEGRAWRFSNAPGYVFDLLAGKDLPPAAGVRLRALAKLGFFAWQVGEGRQDDALDYGATLRARFPSGVTLDAEWRGYVGWRDHDKPMLLSVAAGVPAARRLDLTASLDRGLTPDAPAWEVRVGAVMRFEALRFPRANKGPAQEEAERAVVATREDERR